MKKIVLLLIVMLTCPSFATIVNFDDLPTTLTGPPNWDFVPASYAGLTWTGFEVLNGDDLGPNYKNTYGNTYGPTSSTNFAYNGGNGNLTTLISTTLFDFIGADFTSFVQNNTYQGWSAKSLTLRGKVGGTEVYTLPVALPNDKFIAVTANFTGIDTLVIQSEGAGKYWGMDNFSFAIPVPEPATVALLGLGSLTLLRRKRSA